MMQALTIRAATQADRPRLQQAVIELQEYERRKRGRLADRRDRRTVRGAGGGKRRRGGVYCGDTRSNRFGLISDIYVVLEFCGRRFAARLIEDVEMELGNQGVARLRINALAASMSARRSYDNSRRMPSCMRS